MCRSNSAGFTLLEVIVALLIAGLALVVLFHAGGDGLAAVATASRADEAVERAQSHLAAIGREGSLQPGESDGDDGGGYHWSLNIRPLQSWHPPAAPNSIAGAVTLYEVEVAVSWPGRGHGHEVVLRTERLATSLSAE